MIFSSIIATRIKTHQFELTPHSEKAIKMGYALDIIASLAILGVGVCSLCNVIDLSSEMGYLLVGMGVVYVFSVMRSLRSMQSFRVPYNALKLTYYPLTNLNEGENIRELREIYGEWKPKFLQLMEKSQGKHVALLGIALLIKILSYTIPMTAGASAILGDVGMLSIAFIPFYHIAFENLDEKSTIKKVGCIVLEIIIIAGLFTYGYFFDSYIIQGGAILWGASFLIRCLEAYKVRAQLLGEIENIEREWLADKKIIIDALQSDFAQNIIQADGENFEPVILEFDADIPTLIHTLYQAGIYSGVDLSSESSNRIIFCPGAFYKASQFNDTRSAANTIKNILRAPIPAPA